MVLILDSYLLILMNHSNCQCQLSRAWKDNTSGSITVDSGAVKNGRWQREHKCLPLLPFKTYWDDSKAIFKRYNLLKPRREGNIVKSAKQMHKSKPQELILRRRECLKETWFILQNPTEGLERGIPCHLWHGVWMGLQMGEQVQSML